MRNNESLETSIHTTHELKVHRNIAETCGKKTYSSTGCLKSNSGDIIIEKDIILERWAEYLSELFEEYQSFNQSGVVLFIPGDHDLPSISIPRCLKNIEKIIMY